MRATRSARSALLFAALEVLPRGSLPRCTSSQHSPASEQAAHGNCLSHLRFRRVHCAQLRRTAAIEQRTG